MLFGGGWSSVNGIKVSANQKKQIRAINAYLASGRKGSASALGSLASKYNPNPRNRTNLVAPSRPGNKHLLRFSGNKWQVITPQAAQAYLRQFRQTTEHGLFPHTPRTSSGKRFTANYLHHTSKNYRPNRYTNAFNQTIEPAVNKEHAAHVKRYLARKASENRKYWQQVLGKPLNKSPLNRSPSLRRTPSAGVNRRARQS